MCSRGRTFVCGRALRRTRFYLPNGLAMLMVVFGRIPVKIATVVERYLLMIEINCVIKADQIVNPIILGRVSQSAQSSCVAKKANVYVLHVLVSLGRKFCSAEKRPSVSDRSPGKNTGNAFENAFDV